MLMMTTAITVELPSTAYEQLRRTAMRQNRPVAEVVRDLVLRELPELPSLPADVEAELASFSQLSDDVLWLLARSTLTREQQRDLADLNDEAQSRPLTAAEQTRQQALIYAYDRMLVRRAQAALILKQRRGIPLTAQQRYSELNAKLLDETLSQEEHEELLRLVDSIEQADAERLKHLLDLAQLRNTTLDALMDQLGVRRSVHD